LPPSPASPLTLADLVAARLLDAQLAALAWLLLELGVPVLGAGSDVASAASLLDALVEALPPDRRPGAVEPGAAGRLVRVGGTLARGTSPGVLRAALGATTGRSGLAAVVDAADLAGVLDVLAGQRLTDDEASFLGVVLVADRRAEAGGEPRVTSAHYLRPLVLDAGGHPRRQRPAVLATWEPGTDRWEDFGWGIGPDLAERCLMRAGDFEAERERRAAVLADHAYGSPALRHHAPGEHAHGEHAHRGHAPGGPVG
jgi:hypothetical protein